MAEEVLSIKITADNSQAVAGLKQTETSMQNVSAAFKRQQEATQGLTTATATTEIATKRLDISLGELKDNLKYLKSELDVTIDPKKFVALRQEVDQVGNSIKAMEGKVGPDGGFGNAIAGARKFQFLLRSFAGIGLFAIFDVGYKAVASLAKELGMFGGKLDTLNQVSKDYDKTLDSNTHRAAEEESQLRILEKVATDLTKPYAVRISAVSELQQKYPAYLGNLSQEAILSGQAAAAINSIADALYKKAIAEAASSRSADSAKNLLDLKKQENELQKEAADIREKLKDSPRGKEGVIGGSTTMGDTGALDATDKLVARLTKVKDAIDLNDKAQLAFSRDMKFYNDEAAKLYDDTYKLDKQPKPKKEKVYGEAAKKPVKDTSEFKDKFVAEGPASEYLTWLKDIADEKEKVRLKTVELNTLETFQIKNNIPIVRKQLRLCKI